MSLEKTRFLIFHVSKKPFLHLRVYSHNFLSEKRMRGKKEKKEKERGAGGEEN